VRAEGTRALLTVAVEMWTALLISQLVDRTALTAASRRGVRALVKV